MRIAVEIPVLTRFYDHHIEGRSMLSAVEAMHNLAVSTQSRHPEIDAGLISNAAFDKFLFIPSDQKSITAFNDIAIYNDRIVSKLTTQTRPKKTAITRAMEHVSLEFSLSRPPEINSPSLSCAVLETEEFDISPEQIYEDLVPFGPAYRNIVAPLIVTPERATAVVSGGRMDSPEPFPLGSPFPLDAAFHAACAWSQRYAGVVAFPIGFEMRRIFEPAAFNETYTAVVTPVQRDPRLLIFDIRIYGRRGEPRETVYNVRMKDVSGGRMKPPEWIKER